MGEFWVEAYGTGPGAARATFYDLSDHKPRTYWTGGNAAKEVVVPESYRECWSDDVRCALDQILAMQECQELDARRCELVGVATGGVR